MKLIKTTVEALAFVAILMTGSSGVAMSQETSQTVPVQSASVEKFEGLELLAWLDKTKVAAGEPIILQFTLRNKSKEAVGFDRYLDNLPEKEFYPEVKNAQGKIMPLTEYGKLLPQILSCERIGVLIKSGQEIHNSLLVSRLHDMTGNGSYSITLKAYLLVSRKGGKIAFMPEGPQPIDPLYAEHFSILEITSNTVHIEVAQPPRGTPPQPQQTQ